MGLGAVAAIVSASIVVAVVGDGNDPAGAGDVTPTVSPGDGDGGSPGTVTEPVLLPGLALGIADRTDAPPTIDGFDDDWSSRFQFLSDAVVHDPDLLHEGPDDLSSIWRLAWDPDFLYVHVFVVDDVLSQTREGASLWRGDAIGMYVDPDRSNDQPGTLLTGEQRSVFLAPTGAWVRLVPDADGRFFGSDGAVTDDPDVAVAAVEHADGYQLEARVPWPLLGVDEPRPGLRIGMTRDVSDSDVLGADSEQQTMLSNSPGRTSEQQAMPEVWADLLLDAVEDPSLAVALPPAEDVYDRPIDEAQARLEAAGLWVVVSDGGCSDSTQPGDTRQVTVGDLLNVQILYGKATDAILDPAPPLPTGTPVTIWTPSSNPCG